MKISSKYGTLVSIIVLVVVVSSLVVAVNLINPTPIEACHDQGCSVYYWKCHTDKWVNHNPYDCLHDVFFQSDRYGVGRCNLITTLGLIENFINPIHFDVGDLLKEGIAAKLNVSCPDIDYHYSGTQVNHIVNDALWSGNHITITNVTNSLRGWNNRGGSHR
jgi:hypothetical protein